MQWATGANATWVDLLISAAIVALAIVIAVLFSKLAFQRLLRLFIMDGADFDVKTIAAIRFPFAAFIVLSGAYIALTTLSPPPAVQIVVNKAAGVIAVLIGASLVNGIASAALLWLQLYMYRSSDGDASPWIIPLVRRGVLGFVICIAAIVCLDILGININPLVAGLGIAGLAVALALQPPLGNFFAGTYVISEGMISVGDYIEMSNGINGFVVDVSWRSTRLRTRNDNLVVVPNSLFAETIITNFNKPDTPLNMIVSCGVAYESDLNQVEAICLEVMESIRLEHPGAEPEAEPIFRYEAFGDSNIDFSMIIRARNRLDGFAVVSELIKQLHSRFAAEGIVINYPVRKLELPDGWGPQYDAPPLETSAVRNPSASAGHSALSDGTPAGIENRPDV